MSRGRSIGSMKAFLAFLVLSLSATFAPAAEPAARPDVLMVVQVLATWTSASPAEVEDKLAIPLEREVARLRSVVAMNITTRPEGLKAEIRFDHAPGDADVALVNAGLERLRDVWPTGSRVVSVSVQPSRWDDWQPPPK